MSLYASNYVVVCCRLLYSSSRIAVGWQFAVPWRVCCTQAYAGGHVVVCCRLLHSDCTLYTCTLPVAVLWQSCHITINCTLAGLYAVCCRTLEIMFLYAASCYSGSRVASQVRCRLVRCTLAYVGGRVIVYCWLLYSSNVHVAVCCTRAVAVYWQS